MALVARNANLNTRRHADDGSIMEITKDMAAP